MDEPEYAAFSAKFVHFTNVTPEAFEAPHDMPYSATMCIHLCIVSTVVVPYIPHDYRVTEDTMSMRQKRGPGHGGAPVHDVYSRCLTHERVWGVRYHQIRGIRLCASAAAPVVAVPVPPVTEVDAGAETIEATVRIVCPLFSRCEHAHCCVCNITKHRAEAQLPVVGTGSPDVVVEVEDTECRTNRIMHP